MLCLCEFCGGIEVSLAKCRATAAAAVFYERNFESECFEHFHCCNADVRFVIPHECVVPENDGAALRERGRSRFLAPRRKRFAGSGVRGDCVA